VCNAVRRFHHLLYVLFLHSQILRGDHVAGDPRSNERDSTPDSLWILGPKIYTLDTCNYLRIVMPGSKIHPTCSLTTSRWFDQLNLAQLTVVYCVQMTFTSSSDETLTQ